MINKNEKKIVWALIFIYIAVFGTFTALRHYNFQTQAWDMGIFSQTLWNTAHGRFMTNSLEEARFPGLKNHFGTHMSPLLLLLAPIYALIPSPYLLLFIQAAAIGLGAWPLYLLAQKILLPEIGPPWPLILTFGYLAYSPLHWVNNFDFHEVAFFIPLFLAGFYFLEKKSWPLAYLFLALAAGAKEDAILIVLGAGLYSAVKNWRGETKKEARHGLIIAGFALIYFLISVTFIMPANGSEISRFEYRYANLGRSAPEILKNAAFNPTLIFNTIFTGPKIIYLALLFLPVLFLPLLSWETLILLAPGLIANLLTDYPPQFSGNYHYDAVLIPGIFIGTAYGLKKLLLKWPGSAKILQYALPAALLISFFGRSPLSPLLFPADTLKSNPHQDAFRSMIQMTPPGVSVAAHTNLVPHLASRERVYLLGTEPFLTDLVLIDGSDLMGFADETALQSYADNYINSGNYEFIVLQDRYFMIYKK